MSQVQNLMDQISKQAASHKNNDRFARNVQVGEILRQGDIYIERVKDDHPRGKSSKNTQLAPGTTKGSRHVVTSGNSGVFPQIFESPTTDPLDGPIVEAKERFSIDHPEHSSYSIPSGNYKITYQRDFAMEERARVRD